MTTLVLVNAVIMVSNNAINSIPLFRLDIIRCKVFDTRIKPYLVVKLHSGELYTSCHILNISF